MLKMPMKLGHTYLTQDGRRVTILEVNDRLGYECVKGNDISPTYGTNIWRYNREQDRGRVCGTAHDFSDPRNIISELEFGGPTNF